MEGLSYIAKDNGTIFVTDSTEKRTIFQSPVVRGQAMTIDPEKDQINLAGQPADHKPPLNAEHAYRLYFDRAG